MAITKSYGFDVSSATPITGFQPYLVGVSDFVVKKDEPNSVVVETKSSGYDRPERWTFGATSIANVYKGTSVSTDLKPSTSAGVQVLVKYTGFVAVEDTTDPSFLKLIPVEAHTVFQCPVNQYITADDMLVVLKRQTGGLFSNVSATSVRIDELIRGALKPTT
jgi:hypothetical protein